MASAHNNGGGGGGGDAATGGGRSETDHVTALELQSNRRLLYFSDGVMEELSTDSDDSDDAEPSDVPDKAQLERELPLVPRLRYKASRMGNNILAGIDYVGGGLASFLGITDSKYVSELKYQRRAKEQAEAETDEDLDNWQTSSSSSRNNNNNNNTRDTVVVCEPAARRVAVEEERGGAGLPPSRQ